MQNQVGGINPQYIQNGISSPAVSPQGNPNMGYNNQIYQMEQAIGAQVQNVLDSVKNGTISQDQGQYLLVQLARKAQEVNGYRNQLEAAAQQAAPELAQVQSQPQPQPPVQSPMELFNLERPGFFESAGRGDVLNYIKGFDMDKDEILRIAQLVEGLENSAVDNYLKKSDYEKTLNDENALAKSRLTSYAQNGSSDRNLNKVFTREEIGKMSGEEFSRNEKMIMDQVKQGLIR